MTNPADSSVQNLLPVQAYFNTDGSFNTFIGQGVPFYATANPSQSGLAITNSTINSSVIGGITPAVGYFTSGYVSVAPTTATGIANKQYVDYYAAGLSWKQPVKAASLANITTLSGFQTIDTVALTDGDRVLVKDQSLSKDNGIYVVRSGAWEYAVGADDWQEYVGAIVFVEEGSQAYSAWYSLAQEGGTLGVTALDWANFSVSSTYSAGTGLTLLAGVFSITNTGVTNGTYGSASKTVTLAINAQGQATSASQQDIAIAATQITSGTIDSARLSGSYSGITGLGTLGDLTVTNPISGSVTGSAATAGSATTATTATNLAGGASGSLPYQTASGATTFLSAGTNGQVLTLASGVPSWATPTTGTVTSVSGTGTVSGISLSGTVTSSGSLTLGGTLDLSSPPAIGATSANAITGTTITAASYFISENYYGLPLLGGNLKTSAGTSLLNWDGGGSGNITFNTGFTATPANKNFSISPSGTGTVTISPAGALTVNPTTASAMDNVAIGGTTPLAATFTTLRVNSTISLAGSTGTSGYVMTSNGASAPTWSALPASGLTITDNTSSSSTYYPAITTATSGTITGATTSSTKLSFVPSTGILSATGFSGSGSSLTGIVTSNAAGTGISVSGSTGAVTITNSGVTSIVAGSGISVSGATGAVTVSASAAGIGTVNFLVYTSSTTYTPTSGMKYVIVEGVGGGGGGGGTAGFGGGAGGAGGGYFKMKLTAAQVGASQTVTIGAAGSAGSSGGGTGGSGGTTSFGSYGTGTGGAGGAFSGNNNQSARTTGGTGSSTVTAILINGQQGGPGGQNQSSVAGPGGDSGLGIGGQGYWGALNQGNAAGLAATGYGGGGGGAENGTNGAANAGGAGTVGAVVIYEYI